MDRYSVSQLARISGVSIRTLHHYDKIGLLKPSYRAESNYRYYGEAELHRLQQVLFFKELGFPLKEITPILDDPEFDRIRALRIQRIQLLKQQERLQTLLNTIDKTIQNAEEEKTMNEEELYDGFSEEEREAWKEVEGKYELEVVQEARSNAKALGREGIEGVQTEMENIARQMAQLLGTPVHSGEVISLMKRQHEANEAFYKTSGEMFKGLGEMYVSDQRFTQFYDKYAPGTAEFMRDAMAYYADHVLK